MVSDETKVILLSKHKDLPIQKSDVLVLRGDGYASEKDAQDAGRYYLDVFILAFACLRIGADFGNRAPKSAFTVDGLKMLEQHYGRRVLNNVHGMTIFETEQKPIFVKPELDFVVVKSQESFIKAISYALDSNPNINDQARLAYDLFSASFFQPSADGRFLMLMIAVETLLEPKPRLDTVQEHVKRLITQTQKSPFLPRHEKDSLIGSLKWLYKESISQSGRNLAKRLGDRKYADKDPSQFFTYCYDLRSKLVHGIVPRPTREEVDSAAAVLEQFVGDLLSRPLL